LVQIEPATGNLPLTPRSLTHRALRRSLIRYSPTPGTSCVRKPIGAPLYLGMPGQCAKPVTRLHDATGDRACQSARGWLRPRWAGRVRIWRELLEAAISGEGLALEMARLHGVQLLATELKALEQVSAKEPRGDGRSTR